MASRGLRVVYILPSRYDDEGYVLRYIRGVLPSNTLACMKSLTQSLVADGNLGDDVDARVEIFDDSVQRVPLKRIIRQSKRAGITTVVGFVGVQSNQLPRATDLALELREAHIPVLMGGFHVSGVITLFDEPTPELQHLIDHGVTLVRGEAEVPGKLAGILRDALEGNLKPIYNITESPDISEAPVPQPDADYLRHFVFKNMGTIDTSRGCPFNCSFCTIINVQGRTMRHRSAAAVLRTVRENYARGVNHYFFTDDNFSRNPVWETILDGLAAMRAEGMDIKFMMQVDTQAWRIPRFIDKAAAAGCYNVFIGMETINPENIAAAGKRQNKTHQFAEMVETWHDAGVLVEASYIIGFPHDTVRSVRRDLAVLRDVIKPDKASFFMLTPLPGSRDHLRVVREGTPVDADFNNFDSFHETFRHQNLAPGRWRALYEEAWETFYGKENIVNILLRTSREQYWKVFWLASWNRYATLQRTHSMVTGFWRLKDRKGRRPRFAREGLLRYGWRRLKDNVDHVSLFAKLFFEFQEIWLLTRRQGDPRWATLANLRTRWAELQQQLSESDLAGHCDEAAQDLMTMMSSASEQLAQLSTAGKHVRGRLRRRLQRKVRETEAYLQSFELQMPTWHGVVQTERYISESLVAGYEDLAIRYVAKRRRLNAYRRDFVQRLKTGRILTFNITPIPYAVVFELTLALRFGYAFILQR